jgi:uncharacterized protein DUF541
MLRHVVASLVLIGLPLAAVGQTPPAAGSAAGIQATGRATAAAPVTAVAVRVTVPTIRGGDGSDLLARVKAAGVEDAVLADGDGSMGPAMLLVHGRLTGATRAKIDAVSQAAGDFGKARNMPTVVSAHFYGLAADCPAIEQRAREAALADARRRAGAIAAASNVRLGETLAVVESGGCQRPGPFGGAFLIDTSTMTMRVGVDETVTFAVAK